MKRVLMLAFLALAGCTTVVEPGIPEPWTTKTSWRGARLRIEALPGDGRSTTTPGAVTYAFEEAAWNPFLAQTLASDLHDLGAEDADGAVLTIGMASVTLEERDAGQGVHAEFRVRVSSPAGEFAYTGVNDSHMTLRDSARRAAANALKALAEDEALKKAFTVNPK